MGAARTALTSVQEGDLWRVQIAWANGTMRHFGKLGSEQEVAGWISRHRWLTERGMEGTKIYRPWGSVSGRKIVVDAPTEQAEAGKSAPELQGKTDPLPRS
jgi:hypothetical protein